VKGTGITIGEQVQAAKILMGPEAGKLPKETNKREGQRLSYKKLNKMVFGKLNKEFFIKEGYDGYYAPKKKSVFHGGTFHPEIMLTNAYQKIERFQGAAPVISHQSFAAALPRIFMDYCKGTTRLVRPYGGGLTIFCTGGMGIRLYLTELGKDLPPKIRRTSDFDLGKMIKSSKGVTVAAKDNTLQLSDFESDFRISFDGFDPYRDLEIISRISEKSEVI
jgi:hypothetical protein